MPMPNRQYSLSANSKYRFGYNGKENDDEIKGFGNHIDFGSRSYDSRLGRMMSIDPKTEDAPEHSPYSYAFNDPVNLIDEDGEWPSKIDWGATAKGFGKGLAYGVVGTVAVAAVIATGGTAAPVILGAMAAYGTYETGKTVYGLSTNKEAWTGRKLDDAEQSEMIGSLAGGVVGGAGAVKGIKAVSSKPLTQNTTSTSVSNKSNTSTKSFKAANGVEVKGGTTHYHYQKEGRGVKSIDVADALKNPIKIGDVKIDAQGRPSQRFRGKNAEVAVNPENGKMVSTNPTSTKRRK
jgi:RHS repeat-associated protein